MTAHESNARERRFILGGYEILETLGSGGMGVVYKASDLALGRTIALKVLKDELRSQPHLVARFQREAEAIGALNHPRIVHVYSVGNSGGIPHIAMEYIDGESLSARLQERGPMPWVEALQIGLQIAEALDCAHRAQIIHRDIKPGNILLDARGRAYVTDFGIAKILTASTHLTVDGSRLGTPQYMCPERCRNQPITAASDIYSLGVLLFQTISGRLPYEAGSSVEWIEQITSGIPLRLRDAAPGVPEPVDRLIAHLIERNPKHRPQSAEAVCIMLRRVLEGKPLDAQNDETLRALESYRREHVTPHRGHTRTPKKTGSAARVSAWLRRMWFGMARPARIGIALAAVLTAMFVSTLALWSRITDRVPVTLPDTGPDYGAERWAEDRALASFSEETPGVLLARFELPHFTVASLLPAADGATLVVRLDGETRTPRAGQHMYCRLLPGNAEAEVLVPPTDRSIALIASIPLPAPAQGYLASTEDETRFFSPVPHRSSRRIHGAPATAADVSSNGAAALVLPEAGSSALHQYHVPTGAKDRTLTPKGEAITSAVYASTVSRIAFLRTARSGAHTLYISDLDNPAPNEQVLFAGALELNLGAWNPNAARLTVSRDGMVVLVDAETGESEVLAEGRSPLWIFPGRHIAFAAPDLAGHWQVWTSEAHPAAPKIQRTHLAGGVVPRLAASTTGNRLFAPLPDGAGIAVVEMEALP